MPGLSYQHLDPTANVWTAAFTAPTHNLLAFMDNSKPNAADWKIQPDLATKWETPDDRTFIFHLQPGVKFHNIAPVNGRAVTSEDVKFSLERIATPQPQFTRQNDFKGVQITTPDAGTVTMKSRSRWAPSGTASPPPAPWCCPKRCSRPRVN